jgi:hypothetical protein
MRRKNECAFDTQNAEVELSCSMQQRTVKRAAPLHFGPADNLFTLTSRLFRQKHSRCLHHLV